jgi:hypothetical protein
MHRHYTKNDLMLPLVVLLEEEGGKDNMLSSSCLDVLEAIRKVRYESWVWSCADGIRTTSRRSSTICTRITDLGSKCFPSALSCGHSSAS